MPFKIFVATAGTLEYPRWRFLLTVMVARSLRYTVEGALAVFYGERVLFFMRENGLAILSAVAAVLILCVAAYVLVNHIKTPRSMRELVADEKEKGEDDLNSSPTAPP
jgi:membrane protein DedA with SNARE-associated domain